MIRVVVASRSSVVRAGLESIVRSSEALELAGALDWSLLGATQLEADVLLLDAGDAPEDQVRAIASTLSLPLVLLISAPDSSVVGAALRSGVRGVLSTDAMPETIETAIRAVSAGLLVMPAGSPPAAPVLPPGPLAEPLSDRELEVLELLVEGLSNKLIAHRLAISEHTVKTHVASILTKLGAASRTEAVSLAIRRGLVML